jgi:N-acetylneuraminic acid mutarotase
MFGGRKEDNEFSNDLYTLDLTKMQWEKIHKENSDSVPPKRELHSASIYGENLYIFGGKGYDTENKIEMKYSDIYKFNF